MLRAAIVLLCLCIGSAAHAGKRVALVIGNAAYRHAGELANTRNDAGDMAAALRTHGFEVLDGIDLDKAALERKIRDFAAALVGADVGAFFYAGHGLQISGTNYLVPIDAQLRNASALDFEMVRLDLVQRTMEREAPTNILFLDACRDNPLADVLAKETGGDSTASSGLAEIPIENGGAGTLIAFAASPNQLAYDGSGEHSPFSAALLAHIGEANVSITEAMNRVTSDVFKATAGRQRPWINVSLTTDVVLHKVDLNAPLIVGDSNAAAPEGDSQTRTGAATNPPGTDADQAKTYVTNDVSVLRLQHPLGTRFKVALGRWAQGGCK